jgi:hypothetical protein
VPDSPWAGPGFVANAPVPGNAAGDRSCQLVLRYGFHRFGAGAGFGEPSGLSGMVFLYSDGRLIVDTATAQDWFVQWERHLTPAGVEHVRTAVVANLEESGSRAGHPAEAEIHYGDDIVYPKDPQAVVRLLIDRSWLPDEDWATKNPSIYRCADGRPRPPLRSSCRAEVARVDRSPPG